MKKRIIFFWIAGFFLPEINATVFSEEGGNGNSITQKEYDVIGIMEHRLPRDRLRMPLRRLRGK